MPLKKGLDAERGDSFLSYIEQSLQGWQRWQEGSLVDDQKLGRIVPLSGRRVRAKVRNMGKGRFLIAD